MAVAKGAGHPSNGMGMRIDVFGTSTRAVGDSERLVYGFYRMGRQSSPAVSSSAVRTRDSMLDHLRPSASRCRSVGGSGGRYP